MWSHMGSFSFISQAQMNSEGFSQAPEEKNKKLWLPFTWYVKPMSDGEMIVRVKKTLTLF